MKRNGTLIEASINYNTAYCKAQTLDFWLYFGDNFTILVENNEGGLSLKITLQLYNLEYGASKLSMWHNNYSDSIIHHCFFKRNFFRMKVINRKS